MKIIMKKLPMSIIAGIAMLFAYSCKNQKWDDHYAKPDYIDAGSLFSVLAKDPAYTEFTGLLKKTGYDSLLKRNDLFTVLAVKNGGFKQIDTNSNTPLLKNIIGTHILKAALYTQDMNNTAIMTVSGKPVVFSVISNGHAANDSRLFEPGIKTLNGQIYTLESVIIPKSNLNDIIYGHSDFSLFGAYIADSYTRIPDPMKNSIVGYDATNQPIYRQPIITILSSAYLDEVKINNEQVRSTVFAPSDQMVNRLLGKLLTARANKNDLIIPKIGTKHGDTTVGYYFIPKNVAYPGDSALLKDYLFKHVIVRGDKKDLNEGVNTFTNIMGNTFNVNSAQVQGLATLASNGSYYKLGDLTLPDEVFRSKFMFEPTVKSTPPSTTYVVNPGVTYSGGAAYVGDLTTSTTATYRGRASRFNFTNIGAKINFTLPFATKGYYKVILKNFLDNNGAVVNASYGNQLLKQKINTSTLYALAEGTADVDLGTINVNSDGPVALSFTCAAVSPKSANQYLFSVDIVILIPVSAP
jgi:uncharacterized surface protein with fasciclin (FAS1) repeats